MYTSKYLEYLKEVFSNNKEIFTIINNCNGKETEEEIFCLIDFIENHNTSNIKYTMPNTFNHSIKRHLLLSDMNIQEKSDFNDKYYVGK